MKKIKLKNIIALIIPIVIGIIVIINITTSSSSKKIVESVKLNNLSEISGSKLYSGIAEFEYSIAYSKRNESTEVNNYIIDKINKLGIFNILKETGSKNIKEVKVYSVGSNNELKPIKNVIVIELSKDELFKITGEKNNDIYKYKSLIIAGPRVSDGILNKEYGIYKNNGPEGCPI